MLDVNIVELWLFLKRDLQILQERQQKKCERLEMMCREEENGHWQHISQLQDRNKVLYLMYIKIRRSCQFPPTYSVPIEECAKTQNLLSPVHIVAIAVDWYAGNDVQIWMCFTSSFPGRGRKGEDVPLVKHHTVRLVGEGRIGSHILNLGTRQRWGPPSLCYFNQCIHRLSLFNIAWTMSFVLELWQILVANNLMNIAQTKINVSAGSWWCLQ